jgi:hypothetical protein
VAGNCAWVVQLKCEVGIWDSSVPMLPKEMKTQGGIKKGGIPICPCLVGPTVPVHGPLVMCIHDRTHQGGVEGEPQTRPTCRESSESSARPTTVCQVGGGGIGWGQGGGIPQQMHRPGSAQHAQAKVVQNARAQAYQSRAALVHGLGVARPLQKCAAASGRAEGARQSVHCWCVVRECLLPA